MMRTIEPGVSVQTNAFGASTGVGNTLQVIGACVCALATISYSSGGGSVMTERVLNSGYVSVSTESMPEVVYNDGGMIAYSTDLEGAAGVNGKLEANLRVMNEIAGLKDGWNGNGADAFSSELTNRCSGILRRLEVQPDVFPTGEDSIQFEWEKDDGSYLEMEVFEDGRISMYLQQANGAWETDEIKSEEIGENLHGFIAGDI